MFGDDEILELYQVRVSPLPRTHTACGCFHHRAWAVGRLPGSEGGSATMIARESPPDIHLSPPRLVLQQHKDLQEQFKEAHKASEQSRSQLISPAEIKKAIVQMEEDKEQLERKVEAALSLLPRSPPPASLVASHRLAPHGSHPLNCVPPASSTPAPLAAACPPSPALPPPSAPKVEALHTKLHGSDGFEPMLREVGALRVEQDEQLKLAERMKEQRSHAYQAEQRLEQLSRALAGKKAEAGVSDLGRLLQKLEAEVAAMSRRAHEELPRAIVQRQRRDGCSRNI